MPGGWLRAARPVLARGTPALLGTGNSTVHTHAHAQRHDEKVSNPPGIRRPAHASSKRMLSDTSGRRVEKDETTRLEMKKDVVTDKERWEQVRQDLARDGAKVQVKSAERVQDEATRMEREWVAMYEKQRAAIQDRRVAAMEDRQLEQLSAADQEMHAWRDKAYTREYFDHGYSAQEEKAAASLQETVEDALRRVKRKWEGSLREALKREVHKFRTSEPADDSHGWDALDAEKRELPLKGVGTTSGTSTLLRKATPVMEVAMDNTPSYYEVSHREIVELFGLQPRHLRIFSHPHAHAGMISYGTMIVFKLEHLKGLLFWDRVMIFDAEAPAVQAFVTSLRASVKRNLLLGEMEQQPFEFVLLESLLEELADFYETALSRTEDLIEDNLDKLTSGSTDEVKEGSVYKLLPLEHKLSSLHVRLDRSLKMLDQLLASDEDMAAMYLTRIHETGKVHPAADHLQVELILETYRSRLEELVDSTAEIQKQIDSSRSVFALSLDNARNRIARINLRLTMGNLALCVSMTIAAFFGMNITHGLEAVPTGVFYAIVGASACSSILVYMGFIRWIRVHRMRQHMKMRDYKDLKSVLNKLDALHYAIRGDPKLSTKILNGKVLTKEELRVVLQGAIPSTEGQRRGDLDGFWRGPAARVTDREVDMFYEIINRKKEVLMDRNNFLNELLRWSSMPPLSPSSSITAKAQADKAPKATYRKRSSSESLSLKDLEELTNMRSQSSAGSSKNKRWNTGNRDEL